MIENSWRAKILLALCFLLHSFLHLPAESFNFKNYTVANGLSSSSVNHIFQDSKGYIWFGTQGGGASRFNGKEFKNFTKADGLINNDVTCIAEDKAGNIWIGTASGASKFDGTNFTNYNAKQGLFDEVVDAVYVDASNKIWFALRGGGIKILSNGKFDSLTTANGLPSNEVYSITQDKTGNYWFGLWNGIACYDGKKVTVPSSLPNVNDKIFFSSLTDSKGDVWFGSTSGEVFIIHADKTIETLQLPEKIKHDFIGGITEDKKGNIWLATDHGLLKYNKGSFKLFTEKEGLSVNGVQCVFADYEDHVWAGTLNGGVNLLNSEAFARYGVSDGLTSTNVTAICRSAKNSFYYIATDNGLFTFYPERGVFTKLHNIKEIETANISSLSIDSKKRLWLSTQEGFFVLEGNEANTLHLIKKYTNAAKQDVVSPLQIIHDKKGNTWIATFGSGLFCMNDANEKYYSTKTGFTSDKILCVFEDSHENIWIGTQDAGAFKYNGKTFAPFDEEKGFKDKAVWSIAEDENGNMFFGTGENGLCCFNGKQFIHYTTKDGLCSNYITLLAWDKQEHCLWLGAEKGLNKIFFAADVSIQKIRTYNEHDGFNSVGINQNAVCVESNGLIWFGAINGLWLLNRNRDLAVNTSPKIQLSGIRLTYQKTDWKKYADSVNAQTNLPQNLILNYKNNHLVFDIQALTTDDVLYSFKLEGLDEDWSPPTKNNEINYQNIPAGHSYIFKAKAINSKGLVSSETLPFAFTIKAPWWATWWFRLSCIVMIVIAVISFVKIRERTLQERNRKLEDTVQQRTHEISKQKEIVEQTLTEKEGLLHEKEILLKEIHHRVKNNLQTISSMLMLQGAGLKDEQSKKAITESQNRVRSIALVHQKLYQTDGLEKVEFNAFAKDLTAQITSVYREQSKNVKVEWNIPETYLLIDAAIPMGLILNELLTNSFKYAFGNTATGNIDMELTVLETLPTSKSNISTRKKVRFSYRDSGAGLPDIDLESASTLGLRLINLLSQQIGATLTYSKERGSEFIFTFTINI